MIRLHTSTLLGWVYVDVCRGRASERCSGCVNVVCVYQ